MDNNLINVIENLTPENMAIEIERSPELQVYLMKKTWSAIGDAVMEQAKWSENYQGR